MLINNLSIKPGYEINCPSDTWPINEIGRHEDKRFPSFIPSDVAGTLSSAGNTFIKTL